MFYGAKVWRVRHPLHNLDIVGLQKCGGEAGCVGTSVILLENRHIRMILKEGKQIWSQDLVDVTLCCQRLIHNNEGSPVATGDSCPHHNAGPTPPISLTYTVVSESFASPTPHSFAPIWGVHTKPRFIAEEDLSPFPLRLPQVLLAPS